MSIRRVPGRSAPRDRLAGQSPSAPPSPDETPNQGGAGDARDQAAPGAADAAADGVDGDAVDVAPDEVLDGEVVWHEAAPAAEAPAAPAARPGRFRPGGRGARPAPPPDAPGGGGEPAPVTLRNGQAAAVAVDAGPAREGPDFGVWLSRPWYFGLATWQGLLLGGLLIALVLTRFFALGDRAMHHDESMHAKFAWDTFHGQPYKYNPLLHGPFQFFAVATSFLLFGATEWTARAVPATFGVLLVLLTIIWRRWLGVAGMLLAVAALVFSPSFTYFSRMLREDSYTVTWTMLAATGLVGYVLSPDAGRTRRYWYYAFCVGLSFAFATKESTYITAFIFGTFMVLSVLHENAGTTGRRLVAGAAAGALVGAFWSSVMGYYKKELFEVGGAFLGLLAGAALGFAYDRLRPQRETVRPGDRPAGTFTSALRTLVADGEGFWGIGTFWGGVILFFTVFVILFSSLFTNFAGIREGLVGSIRYWLEQHGVQRGNQPWYYYLLLLGAYETLPFVIGLAGTVYYLRTPTWLTSFLIWWWAVSLVIYSWAGEKMPWLIVHITLPLVLLAARYLGQLATDATGRLWERRLAFGGTALLALWTLHTGWPVNFERPDTPRDLLVYTQTAPDAKQVLADLERLSLQQTGDAKGLGVVVQSGTWWPFSWYLRDFKNAEYPAQLTAPPTKPVVLIAAEDDDQNRPFLSGYSRTRYKMRWWYPEDYRSIPEDMARAGGPVQFLLRPDVRAGLWKWLLYRETTQPLGSYDFYVYIKDGLTPNGALGAGAAAGAAGVQPGLPGAAQGVNPAAPAGQAGQAGQTAQTGQGPAGTAPASSGAAPANPEAYAAKTVAAVPIAQWGSAGRGAGQLNTPRGVALDGQGNVYVADSLNHRIQKFDRSGKLLTAWGSEGAGDGQLKEPMGVAVDGQGNIYVADTWNHRIQKFDPSGKFLLKWTGQNGGFWGPRGIAVDAQGNVYVTDTGNKRIQKFDPNGRFLAQMGSAGAGPGQLNEPIGLAVGADGTVYVADTNNRRIQAFDAGGAPVAAWPVAGWQGGARNEPYVAVDGAGSVYATDPGGARILKFGPGGEVQAVTGTPGRLPGQFELPLGIAVLDTADGPGGAPTIFVADSGNARLQSLALPQA